MLKKYFDDALLLEQEGYTLYARLARETKNPLSQKLFKSLAIQEHYHIDSIKYYVDTLQDAAMSFDPLEESIRTLLCSIGKETIRKDLSQIQGLEQALAMEKKGYALYEEALRHAPSESDAAFLTKLMAMEAEHYEALANVYYYYTDNAQWLAEDESKIWNWMNL